MLHNEGICSQTQSGPTPNTEIAEAVFDVSSPFPQIPYYCHVSLRPAHREPPKCQSFPNPYFCLCQNYLYRASFSQSYSLFSAKKKKAQYILNISTLYLPSKVTNYQFGSQDSELEVTGQNEEDQGKILQMPTEAQNTGQLGGQPREMAGTDGSSPVPRDSDGR